MKNNVLNEDKFNYMETSNSAIKTIILWENWLVLLVFIQCLAIGWTW